MIGWLRGEIVRVDASGTLLVAAGDVGYELNVPLRLLTAVGEGDRIELFVHTHVRADAIVLYGFATLIERATFELLLATPGVGPTTALGALSTMTPEEIAAAVTAEDVPRLATIPGIGKKTASRLVLELSGKLPSLEATSSPTVDVSRDVTGALRQLGYSASEIRDGLRDVELPDDDESALRLALRQLGRV
jgi:holliday junction DNA helicase RuvA